MGHKLLSASSSTRWAGQDGCVASAVLQILCPESESGAAAELGTEVHEYCEKLLKGDKSAKYPEGMKTDKRIADTARAYIAYVQSKREAGAEVELEQKLSYSVLHGGTADTVAIDEMMGTVEIVDLKTGVHGVTPRTKQLGIYLVCERKLLGKSGRNYRFFGSIVQEGVQTEEWTHEELDAVEAEMEAAEKAVVDILTNGVAAIDYSNDTEKNCMWCQAKGICKKYQQAPFERVPDSVKKFAQGIVDVAKASTISAEERAAIILAKPKIMKWLEEVEKGAVAEALLGVQFPGLELGQKRQGARAWAKDKSVKDILDTILMTGAVTKEQLYKEAELISPAQAEKIGIPVDVLDQITSRSEGKAALVPAKDNNANFE